MLSKTIAFDKNKGVKKMEKKCTTSKCRMNKKIMAFIMALSLLFVTLSISASAGNGQANAKSYIENRVWGYGGAEALTEQQIKDRLSFEIFGILSHEFQQENSFADEEAAKAAINITAGGKDTTINSEAGGLDYLTFTVDLGEVTTSPCRVYKLTTPEDLLITFEKNSVKKTVLSAPDAPAPGASPERTVSGDYNDSVGVYGNGVHAYLTPPEDGSSFNSIWVHAVSPEDPHGYFPINCTVIILSKEFKGAKITVPNDTKVAAAWDFGRNPAADLSTSTQTNPAKYSMYFGMKSLVFSTLSENDDLSKTIVDISSSLPAGAITITKVNNEFKVTFNSNYYDEVPLIITYADGSKGYINIIRQGIEIGMYAPHDGILEGEILHGTQPAQEGANWTFANAAERRIYASYYFPQGTTADDITLFATYTWKDGTVTTEKISKAAWADAPEDNIFVAARDFLIFKGTEAELPAKVNVIAVKGSIDGTTFPGVSIGAGTGVEWKSPNPMM